ncbi:hypothetical protein EUTSA_v10012342mg [Eutrema salsugineum]|uniref:Uncharacterized protein n=1 Tax=Eutrema salsugineum TaxID=72664 RepID=V4KFU4_EUTSA|nr:hypothetical protein EUTSA_v10012342mg [Eutrema salsugineum]
MHISIETVKGKNINLEVKDSSQTIDLKIHGPTRQLILRPGPGRDAAMMNFLSTFEGETFSPVVKDSRPLKKSRL